MKLTIKEKPLSYKTKEKLKMDSNSHALKSRSKQLKKKFVKNFNKRMTVALDREVKENRRKITGFKKIHDRDSF